MQMKTNSIPRIRNGGRLPFSPVSLVQRDAPRSHPSHFGMDTQNRTKADRFLDSNDDFTSYLVDEDGNEYEPYSLAWRYLGMYIDCDIDNENNDDDADGDDERRLDSGDGDCERVLLWAAYVDPRYRGGSIGEYQFYNISTGQWDKSTCKTRRCARMDCHEPHTHFKLVGVFKETDGLLDWAEQLFKHEGYCVWDSTTYGTMQNQLERWPAYCTQLYYSTDSDGNTLYLHLKPEREGNITIGIFLDESCTQASDLTFFDYVMMFYENYYGDEEQGVEAVAFWNYTINSWNENMNTYKICQPCRAYNLHKFESESESSEDDSKDDHDRFLENEGEGEAEQWGYDCYDDAGYTNCNQCFKFESKTDLEPVYTDDLVRASSQNTILEITVDGKTYGSGGFRSQPGFILEGLYVLVVGFALLVSGALFLTYRRYRRKLREFGNDFEERLFPNETFGSFQASLAEDTVYTGGSQAEMSLGSSHNKCLGLVDSNDSVGINYLWKLFTRGSKDDSMISSLHSSEFSSLGISKVSSLESKVSSLESNQLSTSDNSPYDLRKESSEGDKIGSKATRLIVALDLQQLAVSSRGTSASLGSSFGKSHAKRSQGSNQVGIIDLTKLEAMDPGELRSSSQESQGSSSQKRNKDRSQWSNQIVIVDNKSTEIEALHPRQLDALPQRSVEKNISHGSSSDRSHTNQSQRNNHVIIVDRKSSEIEAMCARQLELEAPSQESARSSSSRSCSSDSSRAELGLKSNQVVIADQKSTEIEAMYARQLETSSLESARQSTSTDNSFNQRHADLCQSSHQRVIVDQKSTEIEAVYAQQSEASSLESVRQSTSMDNSFDQRHADLCKSSHQRVIVDQKSTEIEAVYAHQSEASSQESLRASSSLSCSSVRSHTTQSQGSKQVIIANQKSTEIEAIETSSHESKRKSSSRGSSSEEKNEGRSQVDFCLDFCQGSNQVDDLQQIPVSSQAHPSQNTSPGNSSDKSQDDDSQGGNQVNDIQELPALSQESARQSTTNGSSSDKNSDDHCNDSIRDGIIDQRLEDMNNAHVPASSELGAREKTSPCNSTDRTRDDANQDGGQVDELQQLPALSQELVEQSTSSHGSSSDKNQVGFCLDFCQGSNQVDDLQQLPPLSQENARQRNSQESSSDKIQDGNNQCSDQVRDLQQHPAPSGESAKQSNSKDSNSHNSRDALSHDIKQGDIADNNRKRLEEALDPQQPTAPSQENAMQITSQQRSSETIQVDTNQEISFVDITDNKLARETEGLQYLPASSQESVRKNTSHQSSPKGSQGDTSQRSNQVEEVQQLSVRQNTSQRSSREGSQGDTNQGSNQDEEVQQLSSLSQDSLMQSSSSIEVDQRWTRLQRNLLELPTSSQESSSVESSYHSCQDSES